MSKNPRVNVNLNYDCGHIDDYVPEPGAALLEDANDPVGSTETKARKKKKKATYATPQHAQAEGYQQEIGKAGFGQRFPGDDGMIRVKELSNRHPDLNQSDSSMNGIRAHLETVRGNVYDLHLAQDVPGGFSHQGTADLTLYDARGDAGQVSGLRNAIGHDPNRPDYHQAPTGSGTNGGHDSSSPAGARSNNPYSSKAAALQAIKDEMRKAGLVR